MSHDYDLLVIGSGPAGQKAAIAAAKLGKRAAIVERGPLGGVCTNTGTVPSKTLREAVLYLSGVTKREAYGQGHRVKSEVTMTDLRVRAQAVIAQESEIVRDQLLRNHVEILTGMARFTDPHTVVVTDPVHGEHTASADSIVIAVGTRPAHPPDVDIDQDVILDSDGLLRLEKVPRSLLVVGAGIIGIEYASMFAALGTRVTVVDRRPGMLDFCDEEIVDALRYHLRDLGVTFRFGERVVAVRRTPEGAALDASAVTVLGSGKLIPADAVLYCAGRVGATDRLDLEKAGLSADERGRIEVGPGYRTAVPHIHAVGDVIGFPSLASSSAEQGRLAALSACGRPESENQGQPYVPIGVYTIPEISYVGETESELTEAQVPYEIGISRFRELARGQIRGETHGMLKLLVHPDTRKILGVHVVGYGATELVHIGQAVMGLGGSVDWIVDAVFNYPTLAEAYKVAALDATNRLNALETLNVGAPTA